MRKREKKKDKFYKKMWKGLSFYERFDRLHSSRVKSDDEAPPEWSDTDASGNDVESVGERVVLSAFIGSTPISYFALY